MASRLPTRGTIDIFSCLRSWPGLAAMYTLHGHAHRMHAACEPCAVGTLATCSRPCDKSRESREQDIKIRCCGYRWMLPWPSLPKRMHQNRKLRRFVQLFLPAIHSLLHVRSVSQPQHPPHLRSERFFGEFLFFPSVQHGACKSTRLQLR